MYGDGRVVTTSENKRLTPTQQENTDRLIYLVPPDATTNALPEPDSPTDALSKEMHRDKQGFA